MASPRTSDSGRLLRIRGTELAHTDTRQQQREKLARITLDSMVQFVGLLDAEGTVLEINKVALDAVGLTLSDVEGKPFWTTFWWQVSPEINQGIRDAITRAVQGEFVRWDTPLYASPDGSLTIIIDASVMPVKDDQGKVVFLACEGRDITEKKAQEREIAQKNIELQGLLERIRELDEIKTQFFANVSHELRTPLALIIGPAERLVSATATLEPAEQRETAHVIVRNARMLLKHVNDLLDISKLEAGKLKLELRDSDVAGLVRFIASHFDVLAAERRITFVVEVAACKAAVDPDKLQRVVMNLLSNAFKFAPAGGSVRCRLVMTDGDIVLSVEDSGPGVKPELRQAIFERFRQGDGGANRQFSGTGLGLAIAHEFVEMHKGSIEVLGSDLGGALFQVLLPLHRVVPSADAAPSAEHALDRTTLNGLIEELRLPAAAPQTAAPDALRAAGARDTVLVVEDNLDMNRFVAQCLSRDYQVISAFDGQQGIEQALAHKPTLIVSDIMMPRVSGVEMIAELRRHPEMAETPILLLSAKADDELKVRLLEDGAQDFVMKPFTEPDLLVRVRNLVMARKSREALRASEAARREATETTNRQLQAHSQHLDELFHRAPSFMAVLRGKDHVFELANAACHDLIGVRDVVGKPLLEVLPDLQAQGFVELLDRVLATGEPHTGSDVPVSFPRASGASEQRHLNFVFQPLVSPDGGWKGVFIEGYDVTERKQAEDALRAADRRKDEFLATLAHELRNPLAPIRHASRISQMPRATEAQLKWADEVIERQVEHMARLLDDLLDVSRITRGKVELRLERLPLAEHLVAAVETVRPSIEARGHRLTLEVPDAQVGVDADPVRFAQIFVNLLTNAVKYTDPGGLIRVRARVEGDRVVVSVRDNGIGIATDLLPRMFEMFSQATAALERSEGGLGIGLALARGLVLLHHGTIEAKSAGLGQGSEFVVTLPLARPAPQPDSAAVTPAAHKPTGLRVLIADDNHDSAESMAMLLQLSGYDVRAVHSGPDALALATEFRPHVALLDIGMPGMNGYEVARQMRATQTGGRVILIAVTGWGQEQDKRLAKDAGFDHHVAKPVDPDALEALLASLAV
jgi:PAS domain S-box-containing protein